MQNIKEAIELYLEPVEDDMTHIPDAVVYRSRAVMSALASTDACFGAGQRNRPVDMKMQDFGVEVKGVK